MNGKIWVRWLDSFSDNLKSKRGPADENPKWLGLSVIAFVLAVTGAVATAQQPAKVPRIGYLGPGTDDPRTASFRQGLRDLGYTEEKNILVEYRYVGGKADRYPDVVAELVQLKVDVLVAVPFQAILAAKQMTKAIPVVIVTTLDPVAAGIIDSLARPGGNITGLARLTRILGANGSS